MAANAHTEGQEHYTPLQTDVGINQSFFHSEICNIARKTKRGYSLLTDEGSKCC